MSVTRASMDPGGLGAGSIYRRLRSRADDKWPQRLLAVGLRTKAPAAEDALVELAIGEPLAPTELGRALDRLRGPLEADPAPVVPAVMLTAPHLPCTRDLATLWATRGEPDWERRALQVYRAILACYSPEALEDTGRLLCTQLAVLHGQRDVAQECLERFGLPPAIRWSVHADLLNPYAGTLRNGDVTTAQEREDPGETLAPRSGVTSAHRMWEAALNAPFASHGLQGFGVNTDALAPFDGLYAEPRLEVDGPLVSVVVSAYRAGAELISSVRSICAQSYPNLEVLLVDDGSGPNYEGVLEEAVAMDTRIQLLRMERNGGTYLARNAGLARARGAFLTTQDSDDWSHPERLERQVAALRSEPGAVASLSGAIRAKPDLSHQWLGYSPQRVNASSLMLTRRTFEAMGAFHHVRTGADSEYSERVKTLHGTVVTLEEPLAVTRLRVGSLSRADFAHGWHAPDRTLYRSSFDHWHDTGAARRLPLPDDPTAPSPFPTPRSFRVGIPGVLPPPEHFPVTYIVDASRKNALTVQRDGQPDLLPGGLSAAVLHLEVAGDLRLVRPVHAAATLDLARPGEVTMVTATDSYWTDQVVVLDPGCLEIAVGFGVDIRTAEVLVVLPPPGTSRRSRHAGGSGPPPRPAGQELDQAAVARTCQQYFDVAPQWVALTPADQQTWRDAHLCLPLLQDRLRPPFATTRPST